MDVRPVKIYAKEDLPRLRYIAGILLGDILGLTWEVISDKRKLGKSPTINYSAETITGTFKISPDSLLFENGVINRQIHVSEWKGLPLFFQCSADSDFPFDIFAAAFFLISRYEEYLEFIPDEFGRFPASASLSFRNGFLGIPVVELWVKEMAKALTGKFQSIAFRRNEYKSLLTVDADEPFAYQGKSFIRTIGGLIRDISNKEGHVADRYNIVAKGEKDPYEVFDYIIQNIEKNNTDVRFFFPVGDYSKYDKNPSWKNAEYRKLIHKLDGKYIAGLHPSFIAAGDSSLINVESGRLKSILDREILTSRFHFIRLFTPQSYIDLGNAGIKEDYSMGYPDEPGFRAGIARPYYFYNVITDKQSTLKVIPFQVMDATLYQYKNLEPAASKELVLNLINQTKRVGGLFVSIWHNTSLLENHEWAGWREVFEFVLQNQKS